MPDNRPTLSRASVRQLVLSVVLTVAVAQAGAAVNFERLPELGLQPQAIATPDGTVHLIHLKGETKASDIIYRRRAAKGGWSESL